MFSLNGTLKKSGSVGRWETKQFIGITNDGLRSFDEVTRLPGCTVAITVSEILFAAN